MHFARRFSFHDNVNPATGYKGRWWNNKIPADARYTVRHFTKALVGIPLRLPIAESSANIRSTSREPPYDDLRSQRSRTTRRIDVPPVKQLYRDFSVAPTANSTQ